MAQNQKPFRKKADIGEDGLILEQGAKRTLGAHVGTGSMKPDPENTEGEQVLVFI